LLGQSESSRLKKFITYPMISSKKSQKRLLITGSTGFVGRNLLLHALHDPEWSEIILPIRNQKKFQAQLKLDHLEDSCHRIRLCSVQDNTWDLSGMPPIDMAIHCAGLTFSRDRNPYFQTHVEGSLHLLESLPKDCPLLVLSSQAAAGPSLEMIPLRQENHLEQPRSWYGESKNKMEKVLMQHSGDRLLIVRPPMILGPRDRATIPLFKMAHGPVRFKPGFQKKHLSWLAVDDLCEAILIASKQDWSSLPQRIYFVTHPHAITDLELLNTAAAVAHARGINLPLPHIIIQLISILADKIPNLREAMPSLGRDRVREIFAKRWVIDGSAFERDFHWKAHRELYETLEETMIWLQQSKDILHRNRK
jgi:nucleoside-diphosphate-sugar epimerase